jgi:hypothetical protein
MKRILCVLVLVLVLVPFVGDVQSLETKWNGKDVDIAKSYVGDGDYAVVTGSKGIFYGIRVRTDGTNNVTINVYDNGLEASGTTLLPASIVISGTDGVFGFPIFLDPPVPFNSGLYVDVDTAGTVSYQVLYYDW